MGDRVTAPVKFEDQQASGLDQLAGAPPLMVNTLTDLGGTRKGRPGISAWSGFPTTIPNASPVDAMAAYGSLLIYVTRDRKMWAVTPSAGTVEALSSNVVTTQLSGSLRPSLLPLRTKVVAIGGGTPQSTTGTGLSAVLGGSPPNLASAVGIATRIVGGVNDTSGRFQWSGLGDSGHTTWDALNYAEAEAKSDSLVAVSSNTNELFAFGAETLQVYSPDPTVAFAPGRTLNIGLSARLSLLSVDDQFAFLDRERRFVITDGRSFGPQNVLSDVIEASLLGLSTVTDCWGFRMRTDRWDACAWMFPTDGKGFIWNRRNRGWSEWRGFGANGYQAPTITSALHWPEQNLFLVGMASGQIAKLDASAFTDLGDTIKVELISGFEDHGTSNLKKCVAVNFVFKRGQTAQSATAPVVAVSYRDDLGAFGQPESLDLGLAGDYEATADIRSAGTYRQRQWKIEYTSNAEFTLVGVTEEYETLAN